MSRTRSRVLRRLEFFVTAVGVGGAALGCHHHDGEDGNSSNAYHESDPLPPPCTLHVSSLWLQRVGASYILRKGGNDIHLDGAKVERETEDEIAFVPRPEVRSVRLIVSGPGCDRVVETNVLLDLADGASRKVPLPQGI